VTATTATPRAEAALQPATQALDAELIARMRCGDRAALAQLYGQHARSLLALAHSLLRDRHDAEDLLHDVFLEAWRCANDYSPERGSVRSWLLMRTRSRALDRLRSGSRQRSAVATQIHTEARAAAPEPLAADRHRLPAALAQVPEAQQGVLVLAYFEGLTTHEISSRLGIPEGTVKSRAHAAIHTLRKVLGIADE
jgi:RNA polymerase sigma-70 factor (ECF subfamily)